jgi:two-component sensor histidine kinase
VTLILAAVFGFPVVVSSLLRFRDIGWISIMGLHVGFYAVLLLMTWQRRRLPVIIKSGIILAILYVLGTGSFPTMGTVGSGIFFYLVAVVLGVLFFGFPGGLVMLVLCLLTVWAAFLGTRYGFLHPDIDFNMYVASSSSWISKIAVFTMLSSLILGLMAFVEQWLNRSMTRMAAEIEDRKAAELELENAVAEKDTLLREIHHRVKTNLQVVTGLLELQQVNTSDTESVDILRDSRNRVRIMSLIHEELYRSKDLSRIRFDVFLNRLIIDLHALYTREDKPVSIIKDLDPLYLVMDTAIPCGLIVNELVSNSLRHAFPGGRKGEIKVTFKQLEDEDFLLEVSDNGIGIPEGFDINQKGTLGLQLVTSIAGQLGARIQQGEGEGTSFTLRFKEYFEVGAQIQ